MVKAIRNAWAKLVLSLLHNKRRWAAYLLYYEPILAFAQEIDMYGRLLTLRAMDTISRRKPSARASKRLYQLHFHCPEDNLHARALYNFLCGMYAALRGDQDKMAKHFRIATKFGHSFHLIYADLGLYYLFDRRHFDRAEEYLNQAIDCIFKYPPLTDEKRLAIASLQADRAYALTMMHRVAEAETLIAKATPAADSWEYLHALAMLRAIQGRNAEANRALADLRTLKEDLWQPCAENVQLILDGIHPHFTAKEPDEAGIKAYWDWFLQTEETLVWHLSNNDADACYRLHAPHFSPLTPEPDHIDKMSFGFRMRDGQPCLLLHDRHSRTYAALIDAFVAAWPDELKSRWTFVRNPDPN